MSEAFSPRLRQYSEAIDDLLTAEDEGQHGLIMRVSTAWDDTLANEAGLGPVEYGALGVHVLAGLLFAIPDVPLRVELARMMVDKAIRRSHALSIRHLPIPPGPLS